MFGLLKKIFKKDAGGSSVAAPSPQAAPTYARTATPSHSASGRGAPNPFSSPSRAATSPATATLPSPALSATAAVKTPSAPPAGALPDAVTLPLSTVVAGLAPEFQHLFAPNLASQLEVSFALPGILPQLSSGRVRVAFGELRQACPNGSCKAGPEHDTKLIELPLASVLSRINPSLLPRKTQRQLMDVPKDVTGLFGSLGEPAAAPEAPPAVSAAPTAPAVQPPAGTRRKAVADDLENIPSPFSRPTATAPSAAVTPTEEAVPAIPPPAAPANRRQAVAPADLDNIPSPFSFPGAAPQPPAPAAPAAAPKARQPAPEAAPEVMPKIKFAPAAGFENVQPAAPAAPAARPAAPSPAPAAKLQELKDDNYLTVSVGEVSEGWPELVIAEVQQQGLADAQLCLPVGEIDLAMRKGKIVFSWKTIRSWLAHAGVASAASAHDEEELQLPLKVVAPRFLALRQPKGRQKKAHVEESIPDLFSGGSVPAAPAAPAPVPAPAPAPAPVAAAPEEPAAVEPPPVAPVAAPKAAARKGASAPISAANPNDLVAKTAQLTGVTGALLAMNDGLVVASQLPKPLKGETVAAFLPQIFGRLTQFAGELKLGDLSSVMLVMDNSPWIIFRTGKVYFAVVGKAGEALPLPQLTAIVADIKRQNL